MEKGRRENAIVKVQGETVAEKSHKTQSYIRSLVREESNLNESLMRVEDENNRLDAEISQLDTLVEVNQSTISAKERDCQ